MSHYEIKYFEKNDKKQYQLFLKENNHFLWYVSLEYKLLLENYLNANSLYLLIKKEGNIVGCLPLMESRNTPIGTIINSLPFYGSNGSFLVDKKVEKDEATEIMNLLLGSLLSYVDKKNVSAVTLITSPFDIHSKEFLEDNFEFTFSDFRIGQITPLPSNKNDLLTIFENPRPRNIRKAIKSGVIIRQSNTDEDFDFLASLHQQNIESIGGKSKSKLFFESVKKLVPNDNYFYHLLKQKYDVTISNTKPDILFFSVDYSNKKESLDLAERIENKNQIKFFEGIASSFDLRQAQIQLYTAQQEFLQAMLDVITKKATLETLLNRINP